MTWLCGLRECGTGERRVGCSCMCRVRAASAWCVSIRFANWLENGPPSNIPPLERRAAPHMKARRPGRRAVRRPALTIVSQAEFYSLLRLLAPAMLSSPYVSSGTL